MDADKGIWRREGETGGKREKGVEVNRQGQKMKVGIYRKKE